MVVLAATPAHAYVGPGAGFVLLSSFLVLFTTIIVAAVSLLLWPLKLAWRTARRGRRPTPRIGRLIIMGFDGHDPKLTDRFLAAGKLPNFARLASNGCYHALATTWPPVSPVAWSSFATGTHPGRHNIFDFLGRDRRSYLPVLSSAYVGHPERFLRIGRFQVPLERPALRLQRKSKPFWSILGEHGIWSTILRVPVTFPPDRFYGAQLSAMSVPDLRGTQGTFLLYTTRASGPPLDEGVRIRLRFDGDVATTVLRGPENIFLRDHPPVELPMRVVKESAARRARIDIGRRRILLEPGRLSERMTLAFRLFPGVTISGTCRLLVTEMDPEFSLYITPINLDPDKPAMPISHPPYYATYLAQKIGPYATLGLAEDTRALNEGVIDESTFLQQTYDIQDERERMFFAALDRLDVGTLACVFDATDRVQHMFWRYLDVGHPAARGRDSSPHENAIEKLYQRNDELLGRVLRRLGDRDVLMVLSDHGFSSFRRGVNLNCWLRDEGYLALKQGASGASDWLRDVDWSATRAYALGLAGIYLNLEGRERSGVVPAGTAAADLRRELARKLSGLVDPETGDVAINKVVESKQLYAGPYVVNAPDLLVGYNAGYRVSWNGATGIVAGPVFQDNVKPWSGDHCIDPRLVPGVFFCNRPINRPDPALVDIAPTVLGLFGIDPPPHMEGRPLFDRASCGAEAA